MTLAIGLEVGISLVLAFTAPNDGYFSMFRTLTHLPHVAILAVFAGAVWRMTSDDVNRIACQRLLWGGFAAIAATSLARFMDMDFFSDIPRSWLLLQGLGGILLGIAGPGLWGGSLARQEDLQDERIPRAIRIFAITSFAGFAVYVASEAIYIVSVGPVAITRKASFAGGAFTLLLIAARVCLLWSTLLSWKPADDEAEVRDQARRIQRLMLGWLVASAAAWTLSSFISVFEFSRWNSNSLMLVWHGVVQATLTVLVAILVGLALERPSMSYTPHDRTPYVPEPPPPADNSPIDVP